MRTFASSLGIVIPDDGSHDEIDENINRDESDDDSKTVSTIQEYFSHIAESNLTLFMEDCQNHWFQNLETYMNEVPYTAGQEECQVAADYPEKESDHFIGFSSIKYMLFLFHFIFIDNCTQSLSFSSVDVFQSYVKSTLLANHTHIFWRLFYNKSNTEPSCILGEDLNLYFKNEFSTLVEIAQLRLNSFTNLFPLELDYLINEDLMGFLRVLFWFVGVIRGLDWSKLDENKNLMNVLFLMDKDKTFLKKFYQDISSCRKNDKRIVVFKNLKYMSILKQKRSIETASSGTYFAVQVEVKTPKTELDSLYARYYDVKIAYQRMTFDLRLLEKDWMLCELGSQEFHRLEDEISELNSNLAFHRFCLRKFVKKICAKKRCINSNSF